MKIDLMTPDDLDAVGSLAEQLGYPCTIQDLKSRFQSLKDHPDYVLFVAKLDSGKIAGYIQVNRDGYSLLAAPRAEISALVVDQTERNKGIGAALLKRAESWALNQGLDQVRLRSNTKRTDAHRFYQKNGYTIPKSWHLFVKGLG